MMTMTVMTVMMTCHLKEVPIIRESWALRKMFPVMNLQGLYTLCTPVGVFNYAALLSLPYRSLPDILDMFSKWLAHNKLEMTRHAGRD